MPLTPEEIAAKEAADKAAAEQAAANATAEEKAAAEAKAAADAEAAKQKADPEKAALKADVEALKAQVAGSVQMNQALLGELKNLSAKVVLPPAPEDNFEKELYEQGKAPQAIIKKMNEIADAKTEALRGEVKALREQNQALLRESYLERFEYGGNDVIKKEVETALAGNPHANDPKVIDAAYKYALGKAVVEGNIKPADLVAQRRAMPGATAPTPSKGAGNKPVDTPLSEEEDYVRQKFGMTPEQWRASRGSMKSDYVKQANNRGIRASRSARIK